MSERDRMDSASIAPGAPVDVDYFNISAPNSIEYNVDQEQMRRGEHAFVDFVVTIPTLYDDEFEMGYTASDALEMTRNVSDNATVDIQPGVAYIAGRRYKQLNEVVGLTVTGNMSNALFYIYLRYTKSTGTFDFFASTSEMDDSSTVKYLSIASATWTTSTDEWTDSFVDLRTSNTTLATPVSFIGEEASSYILTVQNTHASLLGLDVDGYVQIGTTSKARKIDLYGDNATYGLTIHNGSSSNVTLVSDNTARLKVLNNLYVPTATQLGSMTFSATTISGAVTFDCGASPAFSTTSGDFAWGGENFTGVGSIACASVDATGNVQGSQIISDIAGGTAPFTVTSGTIVSTLNVDQVDGYDFDQALLIASSPTFAAITLSTTNSVTFNSSGTDPVISAKSTGGEIYFGDTITLADKETSPDWSITGTGVISGLTFTSSQTTGAAPFTVASTTVVTNLNADLWDGNQFATYFNQVLLSTSSPTFAQVSTTNGPTLSATGIAGASGDNISGFTDIGGATVTITGAVGAATTTDTINGLVIDSGEITTGTWSGSAISHTSLGDKGTNTHTQIDTHIDSSGTIHFTQGSITSLGTIGTGAWNGSAISNTYISGLDQNCLTSSTPSFNNIYVTGGPTAVTDKVCIAGADLGGAMALNIRLEDSVNFYVGSSSGDVRLYTAANSDLILNAGLNAFVRVDDDFLPTSSGAIDIGSVAAHFDNIYCDILYYDESTTSFDHLDDLALIDSIGPSEKINPDTGLALADLSGLPEEIHTKTGFTDMGNMQTLLAGGIKQLHQKVKEQAEVIEYLINKIEEMEKRMDAGS